MNKTEFNYYNKHRNEITPEILGKMFLFEEGYAMTTHQAGGVEYLITDAEIADIANMLGPNHDWLIFRYYISLVNVLRFNFQFVHTRLRELNYFMIILMHIASSLSIKKTIEEVKLPVKDIDRLMSIGDHKYTTPDAIKEIKQTIKKAEGCLRWIQAHNRFVEIVMKREGVKNISCFKLDLTQTQKELDIFHEKMTFIYEDSGAKCPIDRICVDEYKPPRAASIEVDSALDDRMIFLRSNDRVDIYLLQKFVNRENR